MSSDIEVRGYILDQGVLKVRYSDDHRAEFAPCTGGWGGSRVQLQSFKLFAGQAKKLVVLFHSPYQLPRNLAGNGFRPVEGGYQEYSLDQIVQYWDAIERHLRKLVKPMRSRDDKAIEAWHLISGATLEKTEIKNGLWPLPTS